MLNTKIRHERIKQTKDTLTAADWEECLKFFGYKDAYTGLPMKHISQDHIIPITSFGDTIRNNIVPCEKATNSSKCDNNMIVWYKQQIFFDKNRLNKILEWMGEYKKYLYIPVEQHEFISTGSKSVQYFKITLPNGRKTKLYYSTNTNKARMTLLLKKTLDKWEEYLNNHWIWLGKFDMYRLNYEDKTKSMLDRCGSFLLSGLEEDLILNSRRIKLKNKHELLLSQCGDDIQDLVYGECNKNDYKIQTNNKNMIITNEILSSEDDLMQEVKIHKKRLPKILKRYKGSQQYKIRKLYTYTGRIIKELYKLKNYDLAEKPLYHTKTENIMKNENISYEELKIKYPTKKYKFLSEEELIKWQQKPFKNIHGENVYEYRDKVIKGHSGIIDSSLPYIWKWCYVNTDNEFEFNGQKYKISNEVGQYSGRIVRNRRGDEDIVYDMDMILCYEQNDRQFYFDQKIDQIKNKYIQQI